MSSMRPTPPSRMRLSRRPRETSSRATSHRSWRDEGDCHLPMPTNSQAAALRCPKCTRAFLIGPDFVADVVATGRTRPGGRAEVRCDICGHACGPNTRKPCGRHALASSTQGELDDSARDGSLARHRGGQCSACSSSSPAHASGYSGGHAAHGRARASDGNLVLRLSETVSNDVQDHKDFVASHRPALGS